MQALLREARHRGVHPTCLCTAQPQRLVMREVRSRLYLAVWPNEGGQHHLDCPFHREASEHDSPTSSPTPEPRRPARPSIGRLQPDGSWLLDLDLDLGLTRQHPTPIGVTSANGVSTGMAAASRSRSHLAAAPSSSSPALPVSAASAASAGSPSREQPARPSGLKQLLRWLWDNNGPFRHRPGATATWPRLRHGVLTSVGSLIHQGVELGDLFYCPPPYRPELRQVLIDEWAAYVATLTHRHCRGLVFCEIKSVRKTKYGYSLAIRHLPAEVFVSPEVMATFTRGHPVISELLHRPELPENVRIVALAVIETTKRHNQRILEMAALMTSPQLIACSNLAEIDLADRLASEGRAFVKGVGADSADFVLTDTDPPTAMIITLGTSVSSLRRIQSAIANVQNAGDRVWTWNVAAGAAMPTVPAASQ